ncbi:MAG TPA: enoyl-CoA hydratase/isomerase family protein [Bryobacteraceae bacterium]|jgi:enoyl-CoA hydratase/carnithine racemase
MLTVEQQGPILHLTLNRPEKRNALNLSLCRELVRAFHEADTTASVTTILISASGPAFCAGMDLSEAPEADRTELDGLHEQLFTSGYRLRKPIIAAVQGAALAGGTGLVANAHIVICSEDAFFGLTEIRIGLWPILIFRAVKAAIGERRATELSLTGRRFAAPEALAYGLVHQIHPDPLTRAREIATQISEFSPDAVQLGLDYVNQTRDKSWEESGRIGSTIRQTLLASPGFKEGVGRVLRGPGKP